VSDELTLSLRAEVLRRSPRAEDREESKRIFHELRNSADPQIAQIALQYSGEPETYVKPQRKNAAVAAMTTAWKALRSPMAPADLDARFEPFFAEAERHPALLENLAPRMIASGWDWLAEYERVSRAAGGQDPRLVCFDAWAEMVMRHCRVAGTLSPVLDRWKDFRTARLLVNCTRAVDDAISRCNVNEAENHLYEIEQAKEIPQDRIAALRGAIDDLRKQQADIDAWRKALAGTPASWADVVRMHALWAKGRRLAQVDKTPQVLADRVSRDLEHLQAVATEFIADRAGKWQTLDDLRGELREAARGRAFAIDEAWLAPLASALLSLIDRAVENASEAKALRRVAAKGVAISGTLPSGGGRLVQDRLRRIEAIVAAWDALATDAMPAAVPSGAVPLQFAQHLEHVRRLAERVALAEEVLQRGMTVAERTLACRDAVAMAEEILADAPQHAAARALLDRASARLETLRLDEWLERWDVAELRCALESGASYEPVYLSLAPVLPVLDELAALRPKKPAADLSDIAVWWLSWRESTGRLPAHMPDALRSTLDLVHQDAAASVRAAVTEHLGRTSKLDEDRAVEGAVEAIADDLRLHDELVAVQQRRAIHAAVVEARKAGTSALAALVRDSWRTIERYLPWSDTILGEAFERAWNEVNDDALDALSDVLRDKRARGENERFRQWLDWLELERSLSAAPTTDALRGLQAFLQRDASIARRMPRLIAAWRGSVDDAVLVWAYRALTHLDPPLFPGVDPLVTLTRRSEGEIAAVLRMCREAAVVDEAFLAVATKALGQIEDVWRRLEQFLVEAPVPQGAGVWPSAPPEFRQAKALLAAFRNVFGSLARWQKSDLRSLGAEWDVMRPVLLRDLAPYPAAEVFEHVLRKVEPLTRLRALEQYLHDGARRCTSDAPGDRERTDVFAQAACCLDAVIDTLQAAQPEGAHTLRVVSDEYWREVPPMAGDLLPPVPAGGLAVLRARLLELQENDEEYTAAIASLWRNQPNIGTAGEFDADAHRSYLALYPPGPPKSLRVRKRWDDFAARAAQRVILRRGRAFLPEWQQKYVDDISRGVSPW
jgi:hypothetical protein